MKKAKTFYEEAHLFVAGIRVLTHLKDAPPSIEEVCELLSHSLEWGNGIARKLRDLGIIHVAETPYATKIFVDDHLELEDISSEEKDSGMGREIERFKESRKELSKKIEGIQEEQAKKRKDLFAELEKQLKEKKGKS